MIPLFGMAELAKMRDDVDLRRRGLEDAQERLDFTERLLSQRRPVERIPEGG